ncbi:transglutaminaseTgpA domain-containing protein [Kocuria nitroreducens]|uniref:transglutaminaseTgpA domain-containing protein n=1 Tax=Kocuria nitroreducens TaxID=3058914 RepID=UPI0036D9B4EC
MSAAVRAPVSSPPTETAEPREVPGTGRRPLRAVLGLAGTVLVAVGLSLVALTGVLDGAGWVPGALLTALAVVAATTTSRVLRLPGPLAPLFGAGALTLALTVLFLREPALLGLVPTPGSMALGAELWREAAGIVAERPAPYPEAAALAFVTALAAGVVTLFVDTVLVALRLPGVSALGVLALLVVPALVLPESVGAAGTAAAVLAALVLLGGGRRFGAVREPRTAAAPGSWPRALVVGAGVLAVTLLVPGLVPGFVNGAFPQGSGPAGERASGVGPLRAVGQDLRSAEQLPRLQYTTSTDEPELLRVLTLADFSGAEWFPDATGLDPELDDLGPTPLHPVGNGPERSTAVELRDWSERWLPLPWAPVDVAGLGNGDWAWSPRDLTVHGEQVPPAGTAYEVRSIVPEPTSAQLREAAAAPDSPELAPFRELPGETPAALRDAAREQAGNAPTAFDQALALQEWLRSDEFRYDVDAPLEQGYDAGGMASLEEFLAVRTGYAGHFAPAMAVMARELGIPARVAVGYLPATDSGAGDPFGDAADPGPFAVLPRDAHAWPELWFEGSGWVRFEPTPGTGDLPGYAAEGPQDGDGQSQEGEGTAEPTGEPTGEPTDAPTPASTADSPDEDAPSAEPTAVPTPEAPAVPEPEQDTGPAAWLPWVGGILAAALLGLLTALPRLLRSRRRRRRMQVLGDERAPTAQRALAGWAEVEDLGVDHGLGRAAAETPRAYVDRLGTVVPAAAAPLGRLGRDVERALYAPGTAAWFPEAGPEDVTALRAGLTERGGPGARRARWLPRSVTTRR